MKRKENPLWKEATITFRLPKEHKDFLEQEPMEVSWILRDLVKQYVSARRIKRIPNIKIKEAFEE